jgi:hypothetical protein
MKKMFIEKQRNNFLAKYDDRGIGPIPFIMEIEDGLSYTMDEIKNL